MRPKQLIETLLALRKTQEPVAVWGPPGIGKSSIFEQVAKESGDQYVDIRLFMHDPSDFKFPIVDHAAKTVHWAQTILPSDPVGRYIVVLEELPQAAPLVQMIASPILLVRRLGDYTLPKHAWVVTCGNRPEDKAGANKIISPVLNRLTHLDLEVSMDDWTPWAMLNDVPTEIISFLRNNPDKLFTFDPRLNQMAFASPRSWARLGRMLPHITDGSFMEVAAGTVGAGPAAEFNGWLAIYKELPDIDEVVRHPVSVKIPDKIGPRYALCCALAKKSASHERQVLKAVGAIAMRLPLDLAVVLIRDMVSVQGADDTYWEIPEIDQWISKHGKSLAT